MLTFRQFLFLNWLFIRKTTGDLCNLENTEIQCFNCLGHNKQCLEGVMPASYFYKKIDRQYYDCKRVLGSLVDGGYITERKLEGRDFSVFYEILPSGIKFFKEYVAFYNIQTHPNNHHNKIQN